LTTEEVLREQQQDLIDKDHYYVNIVELVDKGVHGVPERQGDLVSF
jgi:hypothetical protein